MVSDAPVLEVRDLCVSFARNGGLPVRVVDGVAWSVPRGKTLALVGESGCGKSVTALSLMRLLPEPPARLERGQVLLRTKPDAGPLDLTKLGERELCRVRGNQIAMVFQEPMSALNPVFTIGEQVAEAFELHGRLRGRAARAAAVEMLRKVGVPAPRERLDDYPHQLSGGLRQRVLIAMALCCEPAVLIADEPTTALDVTIQAQILDLLRELQAESGMSIVLITHDLGVVARAADHVCMMYAGRIVEEAPVAELLAHPLHPYTQGLMRCVPRRNVRAVPPHPAPGPAEPPASPGFDDLETIPGQVPDPAELPPGCPFHPRCSLSAELARPGDRESVEAGTSPGLRVLSDCTGAPRGGASNSDAPQLREVRPGHRVACWEVQ